MPALKEAVRFNWSELPSDAPMPLLERRRVIGEQAMISRVLLRAGCVVPMHQHENEQFACVMSGELRFTIESPNGGEDREVRVRAGEVLHLPSNVPHAAEALVETLVLDVFSPPSEKTGIDRE